MVGALLLALAGCSQGGGGGAPLSASTAAGLQSATPTPLPSAATPAFVPPPPGDLTPALRAEIARAFAPQLRFNAYYDDGNHSAQNKNEDFFPMGVASFLRELASGRPRVVTQPSVVGAAAPAVSVEQPVSGAASFTSARLDGYPKQLVGDAPGSAPLYVHVYELPALRRLAPDGSGELVVYAEYWVFFAYDRCEAKVLNLIPTSGGADIAGHRGDWEHTSYRLRVTLDAGAVVRGGAVEEGFFYGHDHAYSATAPELELLDDAGQPSPAGRHPVVFVSQGKHASFPQAGEWQNSAVPTWLADHTDFFRGNGVWVETWRGDLFDLEDPRAAPAEFAPPELGALLAASGLQLQDWTEYLGRWGPDLALSAAGVTLRIGLSPTGPKAKADYGDFGGQGAQPTWTDAKLQSPRLRVYRDLGITIPRAAPLPLPLRR
ncbi:MAG: hypothetical protein AB7N76_35945 [Planctomycetota bacterium]